ncbi:MAG TPA: hypothetical protein DCW31_03730, partial [Lactobacillus sp.]|nr:hypothetical protein [Lactobacillus sp.]
TVTDNYIKPKHPNIFISVFAFLAIVGLFLHQRLWTNEQINGLGLPHDMVGNFFSRFLLALADNGNTLIYGMTFIAFAFLFWYVFVYHQMVIRSAWFFLLALVYGAFYILAMTFEDYQSWQPLVQTKGSLLLSVIQLIGITFLFYTLFTLSYYKFSRINAYVPTGDSKSTSSHLFLKRWLLMAISWIIYLSVFYPINTDNDFASQISSFFGGKSAFYLGTVKYLQNTSVITDHHPVFTTMVYGMFAKLGLAMGSINFGIYLYGVVTVIGYAAICAYSVGFFARMGLKRKFQKWMTLTYAFFPLFPFYAGTATKNTPYSFLMIILIMQLIDITRNPKERFRSPRFLIGVSVVLLFQMLVVKYAVQIIIIFGIFFVYRYRRYWLQASLTMFLPVLLFVGPYQNGLLPAFHITKTNPMEALSVPFQQTARYVKEYPNDVTQSDRRTLNKVFYYSKLAKNYNPELADPIKDGATVRLSTIQPQDLVKYRKVWLHQFFKHPLVYVEATLNNVYGYFSFNYYNSFALIGVNISPSWNPSVVLKNEKYKLIAAEKMPTFSRNLTKYFGVLSHTPVFSILIQPHTHLFVTLLLVVILAYRRLWSAQLVLLPVLLNALVDISSPANGMFRYMMVFVICLPVLLAYCNNVFKKQRVSLKNSSLYN